MTRDEHRSQAEALVAEADRLVAMMMTRGTIQSAPMVSALTALAGMHLDLAGPEHEDTAVSAWEWTAGNNLVHSSGEWEMEYIHHCETGGTHAKAGWYLYGQGLKHRGPRWVGASPADAMELGSRGIDALAAAGPRTWSWGGTTYDLDKKYRSTRGDFTYEFVGTLTDGMPLVREFPAGTRALINPAVTWIRMVGPFVAVDEDEAPS